MDRILQALEELLAEKPFDRITLQELALRSGSGTSSIYARFRDKQALILGLHARLREQVLDCLERLTDPKRWSGEKPERLVAAIVPPCVKFYRLHGALIRAALNLDDAEMRERQASVLRFAAAKFTALIPTTSPGETKAVAAAIDFSVRMVASVMYSALLFGEVEIGRQSMSDREITRHLVRTITCLLANARLAR
jgi:AcrR family transcriptional regulator